jgi:PKD repeat protein
MGGIHNVTLVVTNIAGRDTLTDTNYITVNVMPVVTLQPFRGVCVDAAPFNLFGGAPVGGTYSDLKSAVIFGSLFLPNTAGAGTDSIHYTYVDTNGCGTVTVTQPIQVNALPATPTITLKGDTLVSSDTTGNQWYLNTVIITGATQQNYIPTQNGDYTVTVTDNNGCSSTSSPYSLLSVGINTMYAGDFVNVFPNPANTTVSFLQSSHSPNRELIITDVLGKEIFKAELSGDNSSVDVSKWNNGVYFYRVIKDKETLRGKFVKE